MSYSYAIRLAIGACILRGVMLLHGLVRIAPTPSTGGPAWLFPAAFAPLAQGQQWIPPESDRGIAAQCPGWGPAAKWLLRLTRRAMAWRSCTPIGAPRYR